MPLRFRIYRWFKEGWLGATRLTLCAGASFVLGVLIALLTDLLTGNVELRWGITVFYAFVSGFALMSFFFIAVELLGLGYGERRPGGQT